MPRRLFAACVAVVFVASAVPAADPKPEEVIAARLTEVATQAAELLGTVTDEKTATDAKSKLDKLGKRYAGYKTAIEILLTETSAKVPEKTLEAMAKADKGLALAHDRVFSKAKAAYKVLHGTTLFDQIEQPLEEQAARNAHVLRNAVQSYAVRDRGVFPKELKAVVEGKFPLIEGGEKALIDPWGFPFRYELGKNTVIKVDLDESRVWTVSPYSGKKLGFPPPEKK